MAKKSPPKTKPKAQLKAAPIVPQDEFIVTVRIENSVYQGTGATALEALQSVPAPTLDLISAGSVRIEHGDKHKEMFYATMPMKRLLNPYNMEVLINDLALGL